FPSGQWQFAAIQLLQHRLQTLRALRAILSADALPGEKETVIILRRHRLNFSAQPLDRESMNSRQETPVAPLLIVRLQAKFSAQDKAFCFEGKQSRIHFGPREGQSICQILSGDGSRNFNSTAK